MVMRRNEAVHPAAKRTYDFLPLTLLPLSSAIYAILRYDYFFYRCIE